MESCHDDGMMVRGRCRAARLYQTAPVCLLWGDECRKDHRKDKHDRKDHENNLHYPHPSFCLNITRFIV